MCCNLSLNLAMSTFKSSSTFRLLVSLSLQLCTDKKPSKPSKPSGSIPKKIVKACGSSAAEKIQKLAPKCARDVLKAKKNCPSNCKKLLGAIPSSKCGAAVNDFSSSKKAQKKIASVGIISLPMCCYLSLDLSTFHSSSTFRNLLSFPAVVLGLEA